MKIAVGMTQTNDQAVVEIHENGTPLAHVILDRAGVDGLIEALTNIRNHLPANAAVRPTANYTQ